MSDEFSEHDLDTPTEHDLDLAYGSKFLAASQVGDKKIRAKILKVRKEELKGNDGTKRTRFVIYCSGIEKPMVLNATNKEELVNAHGRTPANWVGSEVGIFTAPTTFGGRPVVGLRLRVLGPVSKPAAVSKPVPASKPAPATKPVPASWPNEKDDPGFDPDRNDSPDIDQFA
jgi:hypothetical protein